MHKTTGRICSSCPEYHVCVCVCSSVCFTYKVSNLHFAGVGVVHPLWRRTSANCASRVQSQTIPTHAHSHTHPHTHKRTHTHTVHCSFGWAARFRRLSSCRRLRRCRRRRRRRKSACVHAITLHGRQITVRACVPPVRQLHAQTTLSSGAGIRKQRGWQQRESDQIKSAAWMSDPEQTHPHSRRPPTHS